MHKRQYAMDKFPTDKEFEMEKFPTVENFRRYADADVAFKWKDLPKGVYKITSRTPVDGRFGPSMRLGLVTESGDQFLVWAPARLVEKLNNDAEIRFILNEGLEKSKNDPSRRYFAFSTLH
ncbi:hypothetical protein ElyMa_005548700 [Elysia marginata]|uniref:Uncharacterized protein n=1 Tax=Elysia marginata TaxID=1093978 RepID=A0AAV4EYD0_9GAST|nr:hypothetical protein ElyMa_005548700 [Elysia marginata]